MPAAAPLHGARPLAGRTGERGQIMLALLLAAILITVISISLVGIMNTDLSHASIQYAVARSYYIAQAGLEEARAHVFASADPAADATPSAGVTVSYGGGQFTYWIDAGPATGCDPGLKTLEVLGQSTALGRRIPTRVQACAVPGVPVLLALFGVSRVEFQGASRTYLAPYAVGSPGNALEGARASGVARRDESDTGLIGAVTPCLRRIDLDPPKGHGRLVQRPRQAVEREPDVLLGCQPLADVAGEHEGRPVEGIDRQEDDPHDDEPHGELDETIAVGGGPASHQLPGV